MSQPYLGLTTLDELLNWTYNRTPDEIMKAGYTTASQGIYNPLYGAAVWANFNLEANIFAALPKYVWDFSGWRIFQSRAAALSTTGIGGATNNNNPLGGTSEGGEIAVASVPTVKEVNVKPKTLQYPFEATEVVEQLVEHSRDDNYGSLAQQRVYASDQFKERINLMLSYEPIANDTADEEATTHFNLESLVRIVSSRAETDYVDTQTSVLADGAMNVWAYAGATEIDRTTATGSALYDATVRSASGTLGINDVLTDALIRNTLAEIRTAGGKEPTVMIGGQDTYSEVQSIYMNAYRIQNTADLRSEFSTTVNGVETFTGTGAGLHLSTVYGLPLIPSKDNPDGVASNTAGDLFILNTNSDKTAPGKPLLGIQVIKPTVYYEAGKRTIGYPYVNGSFNDRALYEMMAETTCRNFKAQAKIVNISSSIA
jgi:hypothetical protein